MLEIKKRMPSKFFEAVLPSERKLFTTFCYEMKMNLANKRNFI